MRITYVVGLLLALLSTTTKTEDQVEGGLLLNVVVAESATIFELLAGEDQSLLVGWDSIVFWSDKRIRSIECERTPPCLGSWP